MEFNFHSGGFLHKMQHFSCCSGTVGSGSGSTSATARSVTVSMLFVDARESNDDNEQKNVFRINSFMQFNEQDMMGLHNNLVTHGNVGGSWWSERINQTYEKNLFPKKVKS